MVNSLKNSQRRVIPRWRSLEVVAKSGGLDVPTTSVGSFEDEFIEGKRVKWREEKGSDVAIDLLSSLSIQDQFDSPEAQTLKDYLSVELDADSPLRDLIIHPETSFIDAPLNIKPALEITRLRADLSKNPINPIGWLSLGRAYTMIGLGKSRAARRAVLTAVQLAVNNRYILRAAARYFVHIGELEQAMSVLSNSRATRRDPWLASALIAVREVCGAPQKNIKPFVRLSQSKEWSSYSRSELGAALGSLEFISGNSRKARSAFKGALECPTDNSLAQAYWIDGRGLKLNLEAGLPASGLPGTFEAMALLFRRQAKWSSALDMCFKWQADEPYSSRPAILGSFIALTCLSDTKSARELLRRAMPPNPGHETLLNNLILCHVLDGNAEVAVEMLDKVFKHVTGSDGENERVFAATKGLIEYRIGDVLLAREYYKVAAEYFERPESRYQYVVCLCYQLREEEALENLEFAERLRSQISPKLKQAADPELTAIGQLFGVL